MLENSASINKWMSLYFQSSSSASAEEWVETSSKSSSSATTASNSTIAITGDCATKRDDWMSMPGFIPVVSKEKINEERNRERKLKELEEKDKKTYKVIKNLFQFTF